MFLNLCYWLTYRSRDEKVRIIAPNVLERSRISSRFFSPQDGVNWIAFLNKYRLHGVLCDDMGLGKTLQSICMLAADHHYREQRRRVSGPHPVPTSTDSATPHHHVHRPGHTPPPRPQTRPHPTTTSTDPATPHHHVHRPGHTPSPRLQTRPHPTTMYTDPATPRHHVHRRGLTPPPRPQTRPHPTPTSTDAATPHPHVHRPGHTPPPRPQTRLHPATTSTDPAAPHPHVHRPGRPHVHRPVLWHPLTYQS